MKGDGGASIQPIEEAGFINYARSWLQDTLGRMNTVKQRPILACVFAAMGAGTVVLMNALSGLGRALGGMSDGPSRGGSAHDPSMALFYIGLTVYATPGVIACFVRSIRARRKMAAFAHGLALMVAVGAGDITMLFFLLMALGLPWLVTVLNVGAEL